MGDGMKYLIALLGLVFTASAISDEISETNKWYMAQNGNYTIRDSINDGLIATLEKARDGKLNIYLKYFDEANCKDSDGSIKSHDPLSINGTLIKFGQSCNGNVHTFFPITMDGSNFIISEFKKKSNVEVSTYDKKFKALFSARGFNEVFIIENGRVNAEKNAL